MFKFSRDEDESNLTLRRYIAPVSRSPEGVQNLRQQLFPKRFVAGGIPTLLHNRGWLVSATAKRKLVGFALCRYHESDSAAYLEEVAVATDYQGLSIGSTLILECALLARAQGLSSIWSTPLVGNGEADRAEWLRNRGLYSDLEQSELPLSQIVRMTFDRIGPSVKFHL